MVTSNLKDRLDEKLHAQASAPQQPGQISDNVIDMPTTALTTAGSEFLALTNDALDIINENLRNQPLSYQLFDVIKAPSGGITSFSVPGLSGDEMEKEISGIILGYSTPRAYWSTTEPIEGQAPDCYSSDSMVSHDGKQCSRCLYNEFGSKANGDSNGKACKESVSVFLLRPDNIMPIIVRIPVSSKVMFQRYMTRLIGNMIPLYGVVTRFSLTKATNKTGQPYATYNFEVVRKLSPEETASAKVFGQKFTDALDAADIEPELAEAV